MTEQEFVPGACRSCEAPVIWAETVTGRPMPVDAQPAPGGNMSLTARAGLAPLAKVVRAALVPGRRDLRMPHHATCPHGQAWKRQRGGGRRGS